MTFLDIAAGFALLVAAFALLGLVQIFFNRWRADRRLIKRRVADVVRQIEPEPLRPTGDVLPFARRRKS